MLGRKRMAQPISFRFITAKQYSRFSVLQLLKTATFEQLWAPSLFSS
uniref:Uncharacterized protein n=1 Tax=Arundo donax TaxID=35708 RepID=A0A0A9BGT7_ARUDO